MRRRARVYVDTQTVLKPLMSGLAVQPNVDEQISMLARTLIARPNIEKIMRSSDLDVTVKTPIETDRLVDTLIGRIKFTGSGRENIYSISYQDESPDRAKRVVQDLLSLFVESGVGNKRRDAEAHGASSTSRSRVTRRSSRKPRTGSRNSR